jgi:hypothetical protein
MGIQKSDVLGAITVYLLNENRPCPAHYLIDKFGDDVTEIIGYLKKDGVIIGKRGRNGGIVLPDTVFEKKSKETKTAVETPVFEAKRIDTIEDIANQLMNSEDDEIPSEDDYESAPF